MVPGAGATPRVQEDGLMQFGSRGAAKRLALDTFADAFASADPTSVHFARPDAAAQRAFWVRFVGGHIMDSEPRLNFLAKGGEGAIVANLLPAQEVGWLASTWQGLRLLLAAAPPARWRDLAAYDGYLASKRRDFQQAHGPFLHVVLVGVQPALQGRGIGSRLMERVLRYADEQNLPSYLEASSERSRRLYLRHGFVDIETWHGPFPVFRMWRPADSASAAVAVTADAGSSGTPVQPANSAALQQHGSAAAEARQRQGAGTS